MVLMLTVADALVVGFMLACTVPIALWLGVVLKLKLKLKIEKISPKNPQKRQELWESGIIITQIKRHNPKIEENQKIEIQFFSVENNSMWMSFGKKFVTL